MLKQSHGISEELIEWRRDFHMHPETGFDLHRTSKIVADELEKMGYRVRRGVGKTGIVAQIGEGGKMVAIRADMDALPIFELNDVEYKSQNAGAMHACGHDSHTAMALGAALLLSKEKLPGRVCFLFQPCEETVDEEGLSGAQRMCAEGAMEGVDFVIAQHVDPARPVGTIDINPGPASGGVDSWRLVIRGKGGHGAHPDKAVDPFYLTSHFIIAVNAIVSRRLDPFEPAVVSIGAINGGHTENVIPEEVTIKGTIRFTSAETHQLIRAEMQRAFDMLKVLGGDYQVHFDYGGLPMINDKHVAELIEKTGKDLLGPDNVGAMHKTLGAEDFGEFMKYAPGAMFNLGTQKAGHEDFPLHHPKFDLDERALPIGTAMLAETAKRMME